MVVVVGAIVVVGSVEEAVGAKPDSSKVAGDVHDAASTSTNPTRN